MSAPEHTLQCSFEHPELIIGMICVGYYRKRCTNSVLLHINGVFLIVSTYYIWLRYDVASGVYAFAFP